LLPDDFTVVPAVALKKDSVVVPEPPNSIEAVEGHLQRAQAQEECWLEHTIKLTEKEKLDAEDIVAWSAYHASLQNPPDDVQPALTQLLPKFYAMIKHGIHMLH